MSSPQEINIVAIITPTPEKKDRGEVLLRQLCDWVYANEPGTLMYHMLWCHETSEFFLIEKYTSAEALDVHRDGPYYAEILRTASEEGLHAKPMQIWHISPVGGFAAR